ncbi:MAG: response regulator [Verrucomicrobiae bacterium]|nr:response regulator [Verrucomicrobiae bacterium]MCP5549651.1 response regulator [Akkermansiaceae bacterium]
MNQKRILIIDDDIPLTQSMRINLEDTGEFEVRIVNESGAALDAAREFEPDIILLDIVMPGLDGGDIAAALKGEPALRDIPVIMVTALVSNEEAGEGAVVSSADQVMIAKPIRFEKLLQAIEERLAGVL